MLFQTCLHESCCLPLKFCNPVGEAGQMNLIVASKCLSAHRPSVRKALCKTLMGTICLFANYAGSPLYDVQLLPV
jgi:hypothetical protein